MYVSVLLSAAIVEDLELMWVCCGWGVKKKKKNLFTSKLDLNLRKKLVKSYIWRTVCNGAETWTLRNVDQKYLESFGMSCWRRMGSIWTDRVKKRGKYCIESRREGMFYVQ